MTLIGKINSKYVSISNRLTAKYEDVYGLLCDIYFPVNNPTTSDLSAPTDIFSSANSENIFSPHQDSTYASMPSLEKIKFYIPFLLKKESMNSSEEEFDSFYTEEENKRPFIETSKKRELPIGTKVVVYLESSTMYFWIDKKLVVNGADGHMILRQYLAPLSVG